MLTGKRLTGNIADLKIKSTGFTLLELLLVLAIIGLASALIVPKLNSDVKLYDAQIRELLAVLKFNRRMAVVKNQIQHVNIYPYTQQGKNNATANNTFSKLSDDKALKDKNTSKENSKSNLKKSNWYSKGVEFNWITGDVKNEVINKPVTIDFFPQGGATQGELIVSFANLKNKIKIDGFTGRVSLEEMQDNDF